VLDEAEQGIVAPEAELEIAVVVEGGAITDQIRVNLGQLDLAADRFHQDPGLSLEARVLVDGEGAAARHFLEEPDIGPELLQAHGQAVGQRCFAHSMSADECELQRSPLGIVRPAGC